MSEVSRERKKDYRNEGLMVYKKEMEEDRKWTKERRKKGNP